MPKPVFPPTEPLVTLSAPARHIGGSILEWKPEHAEPIHAIRAASGITAVLVASLVLRFDSGLAAATAMGAWSAGMALLIPEVRPRPSLPILVATAIGVAILFGGLSAPSPMATLLVSTGWAWLMAYIGALGSAVAAATTACGVALVLAPVFTTDVSPVTAALGAVAGGIVQAIAALLPPWRRMLPERMALAEAYRALAEDARALADNMNTPLATQKLVDVREVVGERRTVPQPLREAISQLYELRAAIVAVAAARARLVGDHPTTARHIARVLRSTSTALDTMAERVARLRDTDRDWEEQLSEAIDAAPDPPEEADEEVPVPHVIAGQEIRRLHRALHHASRLAERVAEGEPATRIVSRRVRVRTRISEDWETLRTYLDMNSPAMRHALRAAATIAVATGITIAWPEDHSHWVALTAWITLRSDFASTIGRGVQRILGTAIGATIAGVLSYVVSDDPEWTAAAVGLFAFAGYLTMPVSFFVFSAVVAGFALFQIDLAGASPVAAAWDRGIATLVGGGLALAFFALWPTWQTRRLPDLLAELIDAYGAYARVVLSAQAYPSEMNERRLRETVDAIRLARSQLSAAAEQASVEPVRGDRPQSVDVQDAEEALSRAARALIVLEGNARHEKDGAELPGVAEFGAAVGAAYERLAERVRTGTSSVHIDLDEALDELDSSVTDGDAGTRRRRRVLDWETDILTEALKDTALIIDSWSSDD
ncbi:Integral membrane protein YccS N-terminal domain-containing protein [Stackebrandtia soli]